MTAELHLIGTLAQDPDGPERLAAVLAAVQPDVLAVEGSGAAFQRHVVAGDASQAAALAAIQGKGVDPATLAFWQRRLAKERLHYEAFTVAAYAQRHGLAIHFLGEEENAPPDGDPADPAEEFGRAEGEALAALAAHDWAAVFAADYARARVDLEAKACLEFLLPVAQQPAFRAQDRAMAARIQDLVAAEPNGRVAVVCALTHLYFSEAWLTIYAQLYDATTQRHLADDVGLILDHPIALPWVTKASASDAG